MRCFVSVVYVLFMGKPLERETKGNENILCYKNIFRALKLKSNKIDCNITLNGYNF